MSSKTIKVDIGDMMHHATMTVEFVGERRYAVRMWVAIRLIRLAASLLGCAVKVIVP
jgi:hypothetical protein